MNCSHPDPLSRLDVALVSMPFAPLFAPSIGIGLLKSAATKAGIHTQDFYFTFPFAERIGTQTYLEISNGIHSTFDLLGEWIFAKALFGPDSDRERGYIQNVLGATSGGNWQSNSSCDGVDEDLAPDRIDRLIALRDQEPFLDECLTKLLAHRPRIIGFTSLFQQQVATLALAKRIKQQAPEITILMGGANCEGLMGIEILRQFPFVDAIVSGEADLVFVGMIQAMLGHESLSGFPGVYTQESVRRSLLLGKPQNAPPVQDMDALPVPDYGGFFQQFEASRPHLTAAFTPHILFETARGCYWGKVAHCTFCGLNGTGMDFRSKSAGRALDELLQLAGNYPGCPVSVVDNILDMNYFHTFVPELAARKLDLQMCYEVKSNLKKDQVRLLRDAGIRAIQPGIESLSTPILTQMKKGCTQLQNIQLLKWCKQYGVHALWNILWGFPGEAPEEYRRMAELTRLLTHLDPPQVASSLRLDRFSPYFDRPAEFGLRDVRPYPAYGYVYPFAAGALANLAYYFTFEYQAPQYPSAYTPALKTAVDRWRTQRDSSALFMADLGSCLLIWDLRPGASQPLHVLSGEARELYLSCDAIQGTASLKRTIANHREHAPSQAEIDATMAPFVDAGIMLAESHSYLSLAVALDEYRPPKPMRQRFCDLVRAIGTPRNGEWVIDDPVPGRRLAPVAPSRPDRFALSVAHFSIDPDGALCVDLDALESIDLNTLRSQLTGVLV